MRDVTQPVLGSQHYPANQGIKGTIHVPEYIMHVGCGSYETGRRTGQTLVQLDKSSAYRVTNVPFRKLLGDRQL